MTLLWLLLACKRPPSPVMLEAESPRPTPVGPARQAVEGPFRWTGPDALCLDVPAGWEGTTGPAPQLLELTQEGVGSVRVAAWPWGTPIPQVPAGSTLVFHDEDSFRAVPALQPAAAYTVSDADGALTQGWYASRGERVIVVEVSAALGFATRARDAATPLLQGLTRCGGGDAAAR